MSFAVVWKFPLQVSFDRQIIEMPEAAEIVSVAMQDGAVTLWARCDPLAPKVARKFRVVGTGHTYDPDLTYVGTCFDDPFVWHVVEDHEPLHETVSV